MQICKTVNLNQKCIKCVNWEFEKNYYIPNQHPQRFAQKKQKINLEAKIPYLGIFRLELEVEVNELAIFEISTLEFVELGYFVPKREKKQTFQTFLLCIEFYPRKSLNLGLQMFYLVIFALRLKENIVIFEISTFEIVILQSFV